MIALLVTGLVARDLVYVRHAETLANATGHYSDSTIDTFSVKGHEEVAELTQELLAMPRFARILVSPSPRVLRTIAPYLQATHQRATIWPELYECCTGRRPKGAHATRFAWGETVRIPSDLKKLFVTMPNDDRLPVSGNYNAGLAQVESAVSEFRLQFEKSRVLVVGHSGMGGQFLHALEGRWIQIKNATPMEFKN
jgi:broad specificity phosphatase PhoE